MRPLYNPAGLDDDLRVALVELQAGRWKAAQNLLRDTGAQWALRTSRTQMLAVAAARSDVVDVWLAEEPESYDALVMHARVSAERALRAHRRQHAAGAAGFDDKARQAALRAARWSSRDPVPWICLLALAQTDGRQQRPEHREWSAEPMLPSGPWGLLHQIHQRDPCNREAYHRVLQFLLSRDVPRSASLAAVFDFGRWVASWSPYDSPLLLLPAYAQIEQARQQRAAGRADPLWRRTWTDEPTFTYTLKAFHGWFRTADPALRSLTDLHHLAFALWVSHQFLEAAEVFEAMGPYAAREPWLSVSGEPTGPDGGEALFLRSQRESMSFARTHADRTHADRTHADHTYAHPTHAYPTQANRPPPAHP
ncbi:hypothetical protein AB0D04_08375 [Streptomyces sp. NPDC048483]|uniref:hypothetical protein n=1 Tax=Streptomyces sp. NPDC048483 TaxID=3154927 RepID=UPI00341D253E